MTAWRATDKLLNGLYTASAALSCVLLLCLFLIVLSGIVARSIGVYSGGGSDIAGYVMAAATFLALAPTFRAGGHICVVVIVSHLPPTARYWMSLVAHTLMFAAVASLAVYLSRLAYFSYQFGERSEGADALPLWIPQIPPAVGATVFALAVLHGAIDTALERRRT